MCSFFDFVTLDSIIQKNQISFNHGLRMPREEIVFTARPKTQSQSQIFRYGWKHILSAASAHFFRYLWLMPSLGVRSPWPITFKHMLFYLKIYFIKLVDFWQVFFIAQPGTQMLFNFYYSLDKFLLFLTIRYQMRLLILIHSACFAQ